MDIILKDEEILDISANLERDFLKGEKGDRGYKGDKGDKGETGDIGPSNNLVIGNVEKGEEASATITGQSPNQILNLVLPKGDKGDKGDIGETGPQGEIGLSNILTIGTVEKGNNPEANITGESPNQVLNLVLPKGDKGDKGDTGEIGPSNILTIGIVEKGEEASASISGGSPNQILNLTLPKGDKGDTGEKGDKGEKGDTYSITETDYSDIASVVETNIKPTLNQNLKEAKDYTDNAIIKDFKDISYNQETCTLVFTRHDNTTFTVDLPIENTVKNGHYDAETKELVLVLISGQEIRIPATGLIDDYAGVDSATVQLTISADNKISANIKAGSISKTLLTTELQEEINNKVNTEALKDYVKNTDYATSTQAGVIKTNNAYSTGISNGMLYAIQRSYEDYKKANLSSFVGKATLDNVLNALFVTLTQAEYDELVANGTVTTEDGKTYTFNEETTYYIKEE